MTKPTNFDPVLSRADNEINKILKDLSATTEELINKIPESLFINDFLNFFCGEELPSGMTKETILKRWVEIAGIEYLPVYVVDDKTGEFLYKVPALLDRHAIGINRNVQNVPSIAAMLATANLYSEIHPDAGTNYILKNLPQYGLISASPAFSERVNEWNEIFRRYGKGEIQVKVEGNRYELEYVKKDNNKLAARDDGEDLSFE